jgi:hypothetical protein
MQTDNKMKSTVYREEPITAVAEKRRSRINGATLRTCILSLLAFAMAAFLLYNFSMIWLFGRYYIYEPNQFILTLETVTTIGVLIFSGFCWADYIKRIK